MGCHEMKILIVTPASSGSRAGNRATALRYGTLLESAGHLSRVSTGLQEADFTWSPGCVIILHATRGAHAIEEISERELPLVVVLTGTDYYRFQYTSPDLFSRSLELADALICLHDLGYRKIPDAFRDKLTVVRQSVAFAEESSRARSGELCLDRWRDDFIVAVVGHLREEKDSLRAAAAARRLPASSRISILSAGAAHNVEWSAAAEAEMIANSRYHWLGELSRINTRALLERCDLMVISSVMEGGANIVSEACRLGRPIVASDIDGNAGLLGEDYPGLFPAGDTDALAARLTQAENDQDFLELLTARCKTLAAGFSAQRELAGLLTAIDAARRSASISISPDCPYD